MKYKNKKAELSNVAVAIIIILVIIFLGLAIMFSKFAQFKSALGL